MSAISENIETSTKGTSSESNYTYVEGVGNIPRDIFRHIKSDPLGDLPRYSVHIVIQHFLIFLTFIVLAATGLPLHFSDLWWSSYITSLFGGTDAARLIHRIAAITMVLTSIYHLGTVIGGSLYKILKKQFDIKRTQIPIKKDLDDLVQDIKYFLGREQYRPKMGKFMYKQKLHYLAILWGSFVLIAAGSTLLYPETMAKLWPNPAFF